MGNNLYVYSFREVNCLVMFHGLSYTPRSPVPASLHLLALQLKPSLPGSGAPERPLFPHPPFRLESTWRDGDARGRNLIGIGVLITPPFGPFSRSVNAQSTIQPCRAYPLPLTSKELSPWRHRCSTNPHFHTDCNPGVKGSICQRWAADWALTALQKSPNGGVISTPMPIKLISLASPSRHLD